LIPAGIPKDEITLDILKYNIYREISLVGIYGRKLWENWFLSEMLLQRGSVNTEHLIGSTYTAGSYKEAFEEAASGKFGRTFFSFPV
jgi:threonine 3-dehydrogenase